MNILRLNDIDGVLNARLNIFHCEIGVIIPNNSFKQNRFPHQFENRRHGNARPCNTRFSKMNFGADLNPIHATNIAHARHEEQARKKHGDSQVNGCPMKTIQLPNSQPLPPRAKGQACYSKKPTQGQNAAQILSPAHGRQRGTTNRPKKGKNE
jgi:hypothetical protein